MPPRYGSGILLRGFFDVLYRTGIHAVQIRRRGLSVCPPEKLLAFGECRCRNENVTVDRMARSEKFVVILTVPLLQARLTFRSFL